MSKPSSRAGIRMPTVAENRAITKAARADPDAQPLSRAQLRAMVPMRTLKTLRTNAPVEAGRSPVGTDANAPVTNPSTSPATKKSALSIRYSPEVVAYFKAKGDGWQARMDAVLCAYVKRQTRRR